MFKTTIAAIGLMLMATGAASATPATINATPAVQQGAVSADLLTQVKRWRDHDDWRWSRYGHDRYDRHHHYDRHDRYDRHADYRYRHHRRPPDGWHRYHSRPYGWQNRGCLAFGPVWYCP